MDSTEQRFSRGARASWSVLACALVAGACGERSSREADAADALAGANEPVVRSVCPSCPAAQLGGESSDFGGSRDVCVFIEQKTPIDATRATQLGFDVPTLQRRVQREFNETLLWTPRELRGGGPATGYELETRIRGTVTIRSYAYVGLDPEACIGTRCQINTDEHECFDRLELGLDAQFRTLDGALEASATGYGLQGRSGNSFESPAGSLFTSLRDVHGTLQLFPDKGKSIRRAVLIANMYFKEERTEGELSAYLELANDSVSVTTYIPLFGQWPIPQAETGPARGEPDGGG
ncbi:MAG: hypothetical protein ABI895_09585 [Deltaproteobacteria bacterium]